MEFTKEQQEQIDKMIADATEKARAGLFTEDDLQRRVTSEVDRRVESGIQKGLETQRRKWEEEYSKKAQMTAEELAQKELEERLKEISGREKEIKLRANSLEAKELLNNAGVPKEHYESLLNPLISEDSESTKANIESLINTYTQTRSELEAKIRQEMGNVPSPTTGKGDAPVTKESFSKMNYAEILAFKKSNPDLYTKFMNE
jgi:hypothetical protein